MFRPVLSGRAICRFFSEVVFYVGKQTIFIGFVHSNSFLFAANPLTRGELAGTGHGGAPDPRDQGMEERRTPSNTIPWHPK